MRRGSVSGVVLAAGESTRFESELPKQLVDFGGEPLVRRAARGALSSSLSEVIVVVGHAAPAVREAIADLAVRIVENPDYASGQSSSVKAGLTAVSGTAAAAVFLPIDQPFLDADAIDRVVAAYRDSGAKIAVPAFKGRRGLPVVVDRSLFAELGAIRGDRGARQIFPAHAEEIVEAILEHEAPLVDVDTAEELQRLLNQPTE